MRHPWPLLLIVLCAAFAQLTPAQAPTKTVTRDQTEQNSARRKREGAISGRVIGADGQPVPDAQVFAGHLGDKPRSQGGEGQADDEGNFKLTGLSPGVYLLNAYAPGYVASGASSDYDIHRIGENVTIKLVKGGVITGRVTDETGEPIVNVSVIISRVRDLEGKTPASRFASIGSGDGRTDDRGIYRIFGLPPGTYIVYVGDAQVSSPDDAQVMRDTPTYYPSATRDTATEVSLRIGEEVSGIDIRHRGERGCIISGAIIGGIESTSPYGSFWVTLKGLEVGHYEYSASTYNSRGFVFYGVPDGEYELVARSGQADERYSSIPRRISVKGVDVSGIELKLMPHGSIAGRIVLESSTPPKRCPVSTGSAENQASGQVQEHAGRESVVEEITLKADRDDPYQRAQRSRFNWFGYGHPPNEKGEFALKSLEAGRYRITANLPDDGWRIRAIIQTGQPGPGPGKPSTEAARAVRTAGTTRSPVDASRNGIAIKPGEKVSGVDVIVADGAASLNGRVVPTKEGMKLPPWLHVHLIPVEAGSADDVIRYAETKVGTDGSFEFKHIAPGKYLLHARQVAEKEANDDQARPIAWDAVERAKLRREAAAAKNEIELKVCERVREHALRLQP